MYREEIKFRIYDARNQEFNQLFHGEWTGQWLQEWAKTISNEAACGSVPFLQFWECPLGTLRAFLRFSLRGKGPP